MKKNSFLMGILSMALVFGMAMFVGCKTDDDDGGNGGGDAFVITVNGLTGHTGQEVEVSFATDTTKHSNASGLWGK
ncbi:MAG: hypothetical protein LBT14_01045 [Treponema sp.]|jgi:hypothetical protein|nr:hypothetical protein [Treponema sp.]